jgi:hypothetical protein
MLMRHVVRELPSAREVGIAVVVSVLLAALGAGLAALASQAPVDDPMRAVALLGALAFGLLGLDLLGIALDDARRLRRASGADLLEPVLPREGQPPRRGMWTPGDIAADLALEAREDGSGLRVRSHRFRILVDDSSATAAAGCELLLAPYGEVAHRRLGPESAAHARAHAIVERVLERTGGWFLA